MQDHRTAQRDTNVLIVGVGLHGLGIAEMAIRQGYTVLGCADPGKKAGHLLGEYTGVTVPEIPIYATSDELLDRFGAQAHVAILTAAVERDALAALAEQYLKAGINVITIHQDFFQAGAWTERLHRIATETGTSFLATGVQDTWWVHLPNLIAASSTALSEIKFFSIISLDSLSSEVGHEIGANLSPSEFLDHSNFMLEYPAVMGAPIEECARKMGLTITGVTRAIHPVVDTRARTWTSGDTDIEAGKTIGMIEETVYSTAQGITLTGSISARLLSEGEVSHDSLDVYGDPHLHLEFSPFPGERITNAALVNRIDDVITAPPGVHFVADLAPATYRAP